MTSWLQVFGKFSLDVFVSILAVTLIQLLITTTLFQEIVLGFLTFISIQILKLQAVSDNVKKIDSNITHQRKKLENTEQAVCIISEKKKSVDKINSDLKDISIGLDTIVDRFSNDLFSPWYITKIQDLSQHIKHTLESETFYFDTSLIREQDRMFRVFNSDNDGFFFATSTRETLAWSLETDGDDFMKELHNNYSSGNIKDIKRIFIYNKSSELSELFIQLWFTLHIQSGYHIKTIDKDYFNSLLSNYRDRSLSSDFGIYGKHFVWETMPNEKLSIEYGQICVNDEKIEKYTHLFEKVWIHSEEIVLNLNDEVKNEVENLQIDSFRRVVSNKILNPA